MKWTTAALAATVIIVSALLGYSLAGLRPFAILEKKTYDLDFLLRSLLPESLTVRRAPSAVTIVWADTDTADYLGKPRMFWPADFGEVLKAASGAGAKVIGLDFYFSYPVTRWDASADPLFLKAYLEATQRGVPVILAYERSEKARASEDSVPVYFQAVADGNVGYAELYADPDSYIRKVQWRAGAAMSFAAKIAGSVGGPAVLGGIPEVAPDVMAINYYGPPRTKFPGPSMSEVLRAARAGNSTALQGWFKDRIVLIGYDDLPDRHPTPFYLASKDRLMDGVEIHAHAVSTILQRDFLRPSTAAQNAEFLGAAVILSTAAGYAMAWPLSLIGTSAIAFGLFITAFLAQAHGLILPLIPAELGLIFATLGSYGGRLLTQDRRRAMLERAFSDMVSPDVLAAIIDVGGVPLEGRRCEVTVMFSDIRGFTSYSEYRDPAGVVEDLNEYFGVMADCILRNGGMINKYIGDGIMALFGAPVPYQDHARRAVVCAQEMMTAMESLNAKRQGAGLEPWRIGVGIHTGQAVVGFVGARNRKLEYTANGDTVNVASQWRHVDVNAATIKIEQRVWHQDVGKPKSEGSRRPKFMVLSRRFSKARL